MQIAFEIEVAYTSLALRFFWNSLMLLPEAEATHAAALDTGLRLHHCSGTHSNSNARQHRFVFCTLHHKHTRKQAAHALLT